MLILVLAAGLVPAAGAAEHDVSEPAIRAAESEALRLTNLRRTSRGLIKLRWDPRMAALARDRAEYMAATGNFSHVQSGGTDVFDMIQAAGYRWYAAGEIIAWNDWPGLEDSAARARNDWMGSRTHRSIILSANYNYVGIGLAFEESTGRWLWTGVFMKGPDRTGGWVTFAPVADPSVSIAAAARYRTVTISWRGGDIRLAVLTAGLRHYQTQVRTDGGPWSWLSTATLTRSRSLRLWQGHTYDFRARACDRVGNCGSWYNLGLEG